MSWWLLQHLLITGILAALIWAVCRFGRLAPAAKHALWLLVLVKLLVPPVVSWPWPVPDLQPKVTAILPAPSAFPATVTESVPINATPKPLPVAAAPTPVTAPTTSPAVAPPKPHPIRKGTPPLTIEPAFRLSQLLPWLTRLWVAGGLFMAALQTVRVVRFLRLFSTCRPASEPVYDEMRAVADRLGVRPPQVFILPGAGTPLFWSLGKARLLIPEALIDSLEPAALRSVFAHELAHLKRRDHWVRWVELLASCAWWWNPLFWFVRRRIHQCAELACDAWVVWALPEERRSYAETLVSVSELVSRGTAPAAALGMGSGIRLDFERRLTMILRERVPHRVSLRMLALAILVAALALPGWSQNTEPVAKPADKQAKSEIEEALDAPVSIQFENEHLASILQFVSDYVGINIVIDYRVVKPDSSAKTVVPVPLSVYQRSFAGKRQPIKPRSASSKGGIVHRITLSKATPEEALKALLEPQGLSWCIRPGCLWISLPYYISDECRGEDSSACSMSLDGIWEEEVSLDVENEHIAAVMDSLRDKIQATVIVDARAVNPPLYGAYPAVYGVPPHAVPEDAQRPGLLQAPPTYITDGIVPAIEVKDIPLKDALKALLIPLRLDYSAQHDYIWVSTPDRIASEPFTEPEVPKGQNELAEALQAPISVEFEEEHVGNVAAFIADYVGINIVLDYRVIIPEIEPGQSSARDPHVEDINEYVTDGVTPYIGLKDIPLEDALKAMLRPINLYYFVGPGFIWISSPEKIAESPFSPKPVATGPPPPPPPPPLFLLDIKKSDNGTYRALIKTISEEWYEEGEHFYQYTLENIDPDDGTVIISEKGKDLLTLNLQKQDPTHPTVRVGGNYTQDGETTWHLLVSYPKTGKTHKVKVKPGDAFHGLRFVRALPGNHSIELEHIHTKETFTVKAP